MEALGSLRCRKLWRIKKGQKWKLKKNARERKIPFCLRNLRQSSRVTWEMSSSVSFLRGFSRMDWKVAAPASMSSDSGHRDHSEWHHHVIMRCYGGSRTRKEESVCEMREWEREWRWVAYWGALEELRWTLWCHVSVLSELLMHLTIWSRLVVFLFNQFYSMISKLDRIGRFDRFNHQLSSFFIWITIKNCLDYQISQNWWEPIKIWSKLIKIRKNRKLIRIFKNHFFLLFFFF